MMKIYIKNCEVLVIGHWSLVIGHVGAGLCTSGCNQKDSSEPRPYTICPISPISPISPLLL